MGYFGGVTMRRRFGHGQGTRKTRENQQEKAYHQREETEEKREIA
jgi:hypothetical protein